LSGLNNVQRQMDFIRQWFDGGEDFKDTLKIQGRFRGSSIPD